MVVGIFEVKVLHNKNNYWQQGVRMALVAFIIAIIMSLTTETLNKQVNMFLAFLILSFIVLLGIVFDIIGTAVMASQESPFHSMSAKRVKGAKQSIRLVRQADMVASFCNDIVGDIANTVAGAAGASIVIRLLDIYPEGKFVLGILMIALIAAVTVGGKAVGKSIALKNWIMIIHTVGKILYWIEKHTGLIFLDWKKNGRKRV